MLQQALVAVTDDFSCTVEPEAEPVPYDDACDRMPLLLLTIPEDYAPPALFADHELADTVELAIYPPMTSVVKLDKPAQADEMVLMHMGKSVRRTV
eukprot:678268-Lingulodinium_polyedra.AAC.1